MFVIFTHDKINGLNFFQYCIFWKEPNMCKTHLRSGELCFPAMRAGNLCQLLGIHLQGAFMSLIYSFNNFYLWILGCFMHWFIIQYFFISWVISPLSLGALSVDSCAPLIYSLYWVCVCLCACACMCVF